MEKVPRAKLSNVSLESNVSHDVFTQMEDTFIKSKVVKLDFIYQFRDTFRSRKLSDLILQIW